MSDVVKSTVAQLFFKAPPPLNFAHAVKEIEQGLSRCQADNRQMSWDTDDVVAFDLDGARVALGYSDHLTGPHAACLTVSVGQGARIGMPAPLLQRRDALCRVLAERLTARWPVDAVVVQEVASPVTADIIEGLLGPGNRAIQSLPSAEPVSDMERLLARMDVEMQTRTSQPVPNFIPPQKPTFTPLSVRPPTAWTEPSAAPKEPLEELEVANERPALPQEHDLEAARIRDALYADAPPMVAEDDRPSTQMRLAIHAMNATMIVVYAPLGAAVMTYSLLRGENMKLSGRMMALMGTALALGHTAFGQQIVSMI
ncbi:MAG: hypothetical protein DI533_03755 [Cereibacter sphaeroides]|uniref:Uncharacterized protein n=1 Tax=Cereibacter sphaeroides TaxID=1063 RepID=A0A2W5SG17_CERSP|nr:MAG: hypothetical protein DI533_03755 [Cereibacter sphaeroides]